MKISLIKTFLGGIIAGVSISIGAYTFIKSGCMAGAFLFSVGLIAVMQYKLPLYTGAIRKTSSFSDVFTLTLFLALNIIGCLMAGIIARNNPEVLEQCRSIVETRSEMGLLGGITNGAGCGFLITLACIGWEKKNYWALLLGVPAFIIAGFTHSIADAFYYLTAYDSVTSSAALAYVGTVLGNFIGGIAFKLGINK